MKVKVLRDSKIYRGISSLATFSTFITFSVLSLNCCVLEMSAIGQPLSLPSVSAPERLETEKIISREIWDSIFTQWSCNKTLCFRKYPESSQSFELPSTSFNSNTAKMPWPSKRINHSERIVTESDVFNQNKQNNYGRVFLTVSFLLFLSIMTISIARECRQETMPTISSRGRPAASRRRNNTTSPRIRSSNGQRTDRPLESIQIISNSNGGALNAENIGISVEQRELSLSYYYIEPRRMLWNSLHPSAPSIQIGVENEIRNSTQSSIFHPDFQVPSFYLPDSPPTYQEISVHELPSYNDAITNRICSQKLLSVSNKSLPEPETVEEDNTILNKNDA